MTGNTTPDWTARAGTILCALTAAALLLPPLSAAQANGLFENRSWQFQTSADRANNAIVRDMIERKKGGFYDSFAPPTITNNVVNQDCFIAADATGTHADSALESTVSSPTTNPGSGHHADATGNTSDNIAAGEGPLNSDQGNTGDQSASVSDNSASVGDVDASGGQSDQVLNNEQANFGDQTASVSDSNACKTVISGGS